jgi:intracellular septation protein
MKWTRSLIEELGPIAVFGVANYLSTFEVAVLAMVGTLVLVTFLTAITERGWPWFAVLSTVGLLIFVGISIWFNDFSLFAASDTVIDGLLGIVTLWSLRWDKTLIERLFDRTFAITGEAWRILTKRWGVFLIILAILNEIVRLNVSNDIWAYYKVAATVFLLLFGCYQFTISMRYRLPEESNRFGLRV